MSHHLIDINAPSCTVTCKQGQLICRPDSGPERTAPMEDVGAVLINSFSALIHNRVFIEAAHHGTVFVFCDKYQPISVLLPANRSSDTLLTKAHVNLSESVRKTLWHKTVTAKCMNQASFIHTIAPNRPESPKLSRAAARPRTDKESTCARLYWAALSGQLKLETFKRARQGNGLNMLLNYGYTILLSRILQRMIAVGLDPTFGIGHATRERATPLAYDLMEPFRVAVDARIVAWLRRSPSAGSRDDDTNSNDNCFQVSAEYKKWIQGVLGVHTPYEGKTLRLDAIFETVLRGFRETILNKRTGYYRPWTLGNTKWDGSS